jgi:hypothetical protein
MDLVIGFAICFLCSILFLGSFLVLVAFLERSVGLQISIRCFSLIGFIRFGDGRG